MPDAERPKFRAPREGEPIPPVDPEELKSEWKVKTPFACGISQEAKIHQWALSRRDGMIRILAHWNHGQLLAPWQHGPDLDDAVFRIAATFPMRVVSHRTYHIAGDEHFGFDPNAFVQQLIEETGIPHTWEPIPTKVPEGGCGFSFMRATFKGQALKDPATHVPFYRDEHEAKRCTREVFWDAWDRHNHFQPSERENAEIFAHAVSSWFGDFVIDNVDLAQQLISHFSGVEGAPQAFAIVTELEERAKVFMRPSPNIPCTTPPPSQET